MSLSFHTCGRLAQATRQVAVSGMRIRTLRNTFACPTAVGYSDISMVVELTLPDGARHLCEVHSCAMRACVHTRTVRLASCL